VPGSTPDVLQEHPSWPSTMDTPVNDDMMSLSLSVRSHGHSLGCAPTLRVAGNRESWRRRVVVLDFDLSDKNLTFVCLYVWLYKHMAESCPTRTPTNLNLNLVLLQIYSYILGQYYAPVRRPKFGPVGAQPSDVFVCSRLICPHRLLPNATSEKKKEGIHTLATPLSDVPRSPPLWSCPTSSGEVLPVAAVPDKLRRGPARGRRDCITTTNGPMVQVTVDCSSNAGRFQHVVRHDCSMPSLTASGLLRSSVCTDVSSKKI